MNTTMTLEQLPPKGVKREQAILALGKEEANGELLLQLVNTEKGKCKTAAQKALAQLEYAPAAPLWAKLVKGKWMGSHIMSDACSDTQSEQPYHVGCLLGLCIGADCPSHPENPLPAVG